MPFELPSGFVALLPAAVGFPTVLLAAALVCLWLAWRRSGLVFALAGVVTFFAMPDIDDLRYLHRVQVQVDWLSIALIVAPAAVSGLSILLWLYRRFQKAPTLGANAKMT